MKKTLIIVSLLSLFAVSFSAVDEKYYDFNDSGCQSGNDVDSCSKLHPSNLTDLNCCFMESEENEKDKKYCIAVKKDKDVISDLKDQYNDKKAKKIKKIDCGSQFIKFSFAVFVIFTLF